LIENRMLGSCLCSAESTSVVAVSAVGVLGAFAPEVEMVTFFFFICRAQKKSGACFKSYM